VLLGDGGSLAMEAMMRRISMVFISLMAALALSANAANAGSIAVHTPTPNVTVQVPQTKIASLSTGSGAGKVTATPYKGKVVDQSSPNLFFGCATGKHYPPTTK
jgi:type VI protein secretion system component Hcp